MQELTHYIGGAHVKGTSGRFADVYNPATGEVQAKVPLANADELATAVAAAQAALDTGAAAEKFGQMVTALGGPSDLIERMDQILPSANLLSSWKPWTSVWR